MGDRAYTTVHAWPWPGEHELPQKACDALAAHNMSGIDEAGQCGLRNGSLLQGDEESGVIFEIVDEDANYGTEGYRALIDALHEAGLNVYAGNAGGGEYDAGWEYHPAGGETIARGMSESLGATVISAGELIEGCRSSAPDAKELTDVDDATVGAAAKRLLVEPELPHAVLAAC